MKAGATLVALACAACGELTAGEGRLEVVIAPPAGDTVRFEAPAVARRCSGGFGLILEGHARGSGALVWLRVDDSVTPGEYRYLARDDATSPRGAVAAVRYVAADVSRGLTMDSGGVRVTRADDRVTARFTGWGMQHLGSGRAEVDGRFEAVPYDTGTARCEPG